MTTQEAPSTEPLREERPRAAALTYRPYIDGVRAVAVYLVVAFHAGLARFRGGFIGVDVFFVLSGYLVTTLLLRDLDHTGRVGFRHFYARRVRRLLPAAIITLLVTAVVYAAIATPNEMRDAIGGFRAAFLYYANWHFIAQATDYFAANVNQNPVLHFWSLAVEEQFYLVWPLILGGVYAVARRTRRQWWSMRAAVAVGALASLALALHLDTTNQVRAYYGTDARAYQLLAGALLALTPQFRRLARRGRSFAVSAAVLVPLSLAALVLLGTSAFSMSPVKRGVGAAALTCVLIMALENARDARTTNALGARPMAYLGRISYGVYLWHWPLIVFVTHDHHPGAPTVFAISCIGATVLAAVSFRIVEHPVRASTVLDRFERPVVAIGLATGLVCGVVATPLILDRGPTTVTFAAVTGFGDPNKKVTLDWVAARKDVPRIPDCLDAPVARCTVTHGRGLRVVLMGDSDARMWMPAFTAIAQRESWTFSAAIYPGCPWQHSLQYGGSPDVIRKCHLHQDDWYSRVVPALRPDVVILAQLAYDDPASPRGFVNADNQTLYLGQPGYEDLLRSRSTASLQALRAPGRKLVVIEPIPIPPGDLNPLNCLSASQSLAKCAFHATTKPSSLEKYFRQKAHVGLITSIDLDRVVCPRLPTCDPVVHGMIVRRDQVHLTATFARSLTPAITRVLVSKGVVKTAS